MKVFRRTIIALFTFAVTACVQSGAITAAPTNSNDTPTPASTATKTKASPTKMIESSENKLVVQAKADLAKRLSIPIEDIELLEMQSVVWSDASLGCPRPGMAYAQVLSPGYLVVLKANDKEYEYHAGKGGEVFYCENPTAPVPGAPGDI